MERDRAMSYFQSDIATKRTGGGNTNLQTSNRVSFSNPSAATGVSPSPKEIRNAQRRSNPSNSPCTTPTTATTDRMHATPSAGNSNSNSSLSSRFSNFSSSGSSSPPPLCQSASTCTSTTSLSSSPPGSPVAGFSTRIPTAVHTPTADRYTGGSGGIPLSTTKSMSPYHHGRHSPTFGVASNSTRNSNHQRPPITGSMPQSPSKSWDEGEDHPDNFRGNGTGFRHYGLNVHHQTSSPLRSNSTAASPGRLPETSPVLIPFGRVQSDLTGHSSLSSTSLSPSLRPRYNLNPRLSGSVGGLQMRNPSKTMFNMGNDSSLFTPDPIHHHVDEVDRRANTSSHQYVNNNITSVDPPETPVFVDIQKRGPFHDTRKTTNTAEDTLHQQQQLQLQQRPPTPTFNTTIGSIHSTQPPSSSTLSAGIVAEDDVSSLGGVEDHSATSSQQLQPPSLSPPPPPVPSQSLIRLAFAIRSNSSKPNNLSVDENTLWDAVQAALRQARQDSSPCKSPINASKPLKARSSFTSSEPVSPPPSAFTSSHLQPIQRYLYPPPPSSTSSSWGEKLADKCCTSEAQVLALKQQEDNSRSLIAIQRVLADVETEPNMAIELVPDSEQITSPSTIFNSSSSRSTVVDNKHQQQTALHQPCGGVAVATVGFNCFDNGNFVDHQYRDEVKALKQELRLAKERIQQLEEETPAASAIVTKDQALKPTNYQQNKQNHQHDDKDLKSNSDHNHSRRYRDEEVSPSAAELVDRLQSELTNKSSALENAKMIITSLENASNTLAADLRAKIRAKDEECSKLRKDAEDRQCTLDTLAMELRDLQCSRPNFTISETDRCRRLALSSRLEKNMAEVRALTVVLECTQDPTSFQSLGDLLADSLDALKQGINMIDDFGDDGAVGSFTCSTDDGSPRFKRSSSSDCFASTASRKLRVELDETKKTAKHLEESIRKYKDEIKRIRAQMEGLRRNRDEEVQSLQTEIKILRKQCSTNMEVLTRKERELAVLRDSLQVEDVGYISDDNSEGDDEDAEVEALDGSAANNRKGIARPQAQGVNPHIPSTEYGPSQAEALATLLAQGIGATNPSSDFLSFGNDTVPASALAVQNQIEALQKELARVGAEHEKAIRELKIDKESLSNAKMIISSLECANKRMMEDLRSRLQDSNSAIACLLEKSLESEKTSNRLRLELAEALERERERRIYTDQQQFCDSSNIGTATSTSSIPHALLTLPIETID